MRKKRGPVEDRLAIEGMTWKDAMGKAIRKPVPKGGVPARVVKRRKKRAK